VAACGDVLTYARALTALEELRCAQPQLAVAASGGSLLVRIQRLLRGRPPAFYRFESGLAGFIALATVFILLAGAQTALLSRNAKAFAKDAGILTLSEMIPRTGDRTADRLPASKIAPEPADRAATPTDDASPIGEVDVPDSTPALSEAAYRDDKNIAGSDAFLSGMVAAGLTNLKAEQLATLIVNGITAEFVREMTALVPARLTVDRIVAMRIHGVTSGFVEELKAQGLANLSADQLIAFRVHGVTSQYVAELKNVGYGNATANSLLAFRIHGVTPVFIQQMKDMGFASLSGDQLTAFRIHGVTPLFVEAMRSFIRGKLSADHLIALRIHGVSPEMIKELEIMGFANLAANQLMGFRIHGVTSGFIKAIQEAGYDRITPDQLTELKIFGVTRSSSGWSKTADSPM
jgi:hypothetical protein